MDGGRSVYFIKMLSLHNNRMLSSSPLNARVLSEETTLMGYHIPAEVCSQYSHFTIHVYDVQFDLLIIIIYSAKST